MVGIEFVKLITITFSISSAIYGNDDFNSVNRSLTSRYKCIPMKSSIGLIYGIVSSRRAGKWPAQLVEAVLCFRAIDPINCQFYLEG
jgi:hypothetical protein